MLKLRNRCRTAPPTFSSDWKCLTQIDIAMLCLGMELRKLDGHKRLTVFALSPTCTPHEVYAFAFYREVTPPNRRVRTFNGETSSFISKNELKKRLCNLGFRAPIIERAVAWLCRGTPAKHRTATV